MDDLERHQQRRHESLRSWAKTVSLLVVALAVAAFFITLAFQLAGGDDHDVDQTFTALSGGDPTGWLLTTVAVLISGVYVFTTFRIDRGVKTEARSVAEDEVREYLEGHAQETMEDLKAQIGKELSELQCTHQKLESEYRKRQAEYLCDAEKNLNKQVKELISNRSKELDVVVDTMRSKVAGTDPVDDLNKVIARVVDAERKRRSFLQRLFTATRMGGGKRDDSDRH